MRIPLPVGGLGRGEGNGGTWARSRLFHFWGPGSPVLSLASGPVLWLAARCGPVHEDAGKTSCLDLTIPRLK